jgi:hypothetical protein
VNDNKNVDVKCHQTMKCLFCYNILISFYNLEIQARKCVIIYNTTNRIITSKEHVNANHFIVAKMFEEEIYNPLKKKSGEITSQKSLDPLVTQFSNFLVPKIFSKRIICNRNCSLRIWAYIDC